MNIPKLVVGMLVGASFAQITCEQIRLKLQDKKAKYKYALATGSTILQNSAYKDISTSDATRLSFDPENNPMLYVKKSSGSTTPQELSLSDVRAKKSEGYDVVIVYSVGKPGVNWTLGYGSEENLRGLRKK